MKNQNIQHGFFENKEHYLNFRKAWSKAFHNSQNRKLQVRTWTSNIEDTHRRNIFLPGEYHLFYNAMIGNDVTKIFSESALDKSVLGSCARTLYFLTRDELNAKFDDTITRDMYYQFRWAFFNETVPSDITPTFIDKLKNWVAA